MLNKNGFSLTELLVIIAITGILVGIAAVAGSAYWNRSNVETQMKEFDAELIKARVSAMQTGRMYFVDFAPAPTAITQYAIYEDRDAVNPLAEGSGVLEPGIDRIVAQRSLDAKYTMMIPGALGTGQITFDPRGLVTGGLVGTATIIRVITSYGSAYNCIEISTTRTRTGAWNGANCDTQ